MELNRVLWTLDLIDLGLPLIFETATLDCADRKRIFSRTPVLRVAASTVVHDGAVAITDDDAAELAELWRRIYGPTGMVGFTEVDVDRLRSLESEGGSESQIVRGSAPDDERRPTNQMRMHPRR